MRRSSRYINTYGSKCDECGSKALVQTTYMWVANEGMDWEEHLDYTTCPACEIKSRIRSVLYPARKFWSALRFAACHAGIRRPKLFLKLLKLYLEIKILS